MLCFSPFFLLKIELLSSVLTRCLKYKHGKNKSGGSSHGREVSKEHFVFTLLDHVVAN